MNKVSEARHPELDLGLGFPRRDCFVAIAPRNDSVVIASVAKQSQTDSSSTSRRTQNDKWASIILKHKNLALAGVFVFFVAGFFAMSSLQAHKAEAAACNATTTGNWSVGSNWTSCTGAGGVPASTDTITINQGVTITADTGTMTVAGLTIATGAGANGLSISTGQLVTVNGNVAFTANANAVNQTITLNGTGNLTVTGTFSMPNPTSTGSSLVTCAASATGTLSIGSTLTMTASNATGGDVIITGLTCTIDVTGLTTMTGSSTAGVTAIINSTTGTLWFRGGLTFAGTAAQTQLTISSSGTLKFAGTMNNSGTVSITIASVQFTGNATLNKTLTMGTVTINSGVVVTLGIAQTITGNLINNNTTGSWTGAFTTTMTGAGSSITGNTTFNALTIGATATVTVAANTTVTVTNALTTTQASTAITQLAWNASTSVLTAGSVTFNNNSGANTVTWAVGAGTFTVTGEIVFNSSSATATRIGKLSLTTGTINANGGIDTSGTGSACAACNTIDISGGAGVFNLKGNIQTTNANGASGWTFTNTTCTSTGGQFGFIDTAAAQTVYLPGAGGYCRLFINNTNASGATLGAAITTSNLKEGVTVGDDSAAAIFLNGGFAIAGNASKVFLVNNVATFKMTGSSNLPTGFTGGLTFDANSTVEYNQSSAPTMTTAITYGNLSFKTTTNSLTFALPAAITIGGNLTIGNGTSTGSIVTADTSDPTVTVSGTFAVSNGATFTASNSAAFTVNGNTTIGGGSTGVFTAAAGGAVNLKGDLTLASGATWTKGAGTLTFQEGTSSQILTDNTASKQDLGPVVVAAGGGATTLASATAFKVTTITVNASQNLDISSDTMTITGSGFTWNGTTFTSTGSTVDYNSASTTALANLTYNNLTISGTLNAVTGSATVGNLFLVSGTFSPNAGTLTLQNDLDRKSVV